MSHPNLRQKPRVCYYEPEEPSFDDYTYCDECADFVYEYCAIHGPLLVIPDDKVPTKSTYPPYVPRAALTIPQVFLHLAPSIIPGAGLGVFSTLTLPRGVRFGPYRGKHTQDVVSTYCWQIYDRNIKPSHVVDALDGDRSNWMRYVNCARHWKEQNLLAYQYQGELYYRTIQIVPRFTELMVFYGSEFANALHINLSKYNSPLEHTRTLGTAKIESKTKESTAFDLLEARNNDNKRMEENDICLSIDEIEIIDEYNGKDQNDKINVNSIDNNTIVNDEIGNNFDNTSSMEVTCSGDNINIHFNNIIDDKEKKYKCHICDKHFGNGRNLRSHIKRHDMKYNCELCDYKSNSKSRFDEHVKNHNKVFDYNCHLCFYQTNIKRNFTRHCRTHQIVKNVAIKSPKTCNEISKNIIRQCDLCDFNTVSRKRFANHKSQHKGNIYKCDQCNYSNHSNYNLNRHIAKRH